jgi:hypothetical protein
MKHQSRWQRIQQRNDEYRGKEISNLKRKIEDAKIESALIQNLCLNQRDIFKEIIAICSQEHMEHLDISEKIERIESYARRALAAE